ncbi:MAG: hypothetical protein ACRDKA_06060 [Actinomycetota bacterium]
MLDLETTIRDGLRAHASDALPRTMPPGTVRAVRLRQARFGAAAAVMTAAALLGAVVLFRTLPWGPEGLRPAGRPLIPPDHLIEAVPPGWPRVDVLDPSGPPPIPVEDADADGGVEVLAAGTAGDAQFWFMAWFGGRQEDGVPGPCIGFAGPSAGKTPPTDTALGGVSGPISYTCAHWQEQSVPEEADLYLAGQRSPESAPGIAANYGILSERVARLEVRLDDGSSAEVPILDGPLGWTDVRAFLFFPPAGRQGTLIALDRSGNALARAAMCDGVEEGGAGGCAGPTEQLGQPGPGSRGTESGRYPRGAFDWCPSPPFLEPGPGWSRQAARTALDFVDASRAGDAAAARRLLDPSVPPDAYLVSTAAEPIAAAVIRTSMEGPLVEFGCGSEVEAHTAAVEIDDGTVSASLDFTLFLVLREDGWKVWGVIP